VCAKGLAVDWETTGLDVNKHQGISFGAIVFDTTTFAELDAIYAEIKFNPKYEWTKGAENIHGLSQAHLALNGIGQVDAATALVEFIFEHFGTGKVMFLGHNPTFDIGFTRQLLSTIDFTIGPEAKDGPHVRLHHVVLDTSALGFITLGTYKSNELFQRIGLPPRAKHDALEDIRYTLKTAATIKQVVAEVVD